MGSFFKWIDATLRRMFPFLARIPAFEQFLKFCLVGLSGVAVDMGTMLFFVDVVRFDPRLAVIPAFLVAATTNYALNRAWTFQGTESRVASSYATFIVVCALGAALRVGLMHVLLFVRFFAEGHGYLIANFIGIVVATIFNFVGSRYIVFGRKKR